jgi:hypothetical protein
MLIRQKKYGLLYHNLKLLIMRKILSISLLALSTLVFVGCDKETDWKAKAENVPAGKSFLKINYVSAYAANPGVILSLNNARVSNTITARTPFPGGGYNTGGGSQGDYLGVAAGHNSLAVTIPNKSFYADSVVLFTTSLNLNPEKYYTVHITDTASKTKVVVTMDDLTQPDTGSTRFRFINLMPNVPAVDLYYGTTKVASNIAYLSTSDYVTMKVPATNLAWTIREAGAAPTSTALATYTSGNTTLSQRVYTAFAVGYKGSTDAARRPYIVRPEQISINVYHKK